MMDNANGKLTGPSGTLTGQLLISVRERLDGGVNNSQGQ